MRKLKTTFERVIVLFYTDLVFNLILLFLLLNILSQCLLLKFYRTLLKFILRSLLNISNMYHFFCFIYLRKRVHFFK